MNKRLLKFVRHFKTYEDFTLECKKTNLDLETAGVIWMKMLKQVQSKVIIHKILVMIVTGNIK